MTCERCRKNVGIMGDLFGHACLVPETPTWSVPIAMTEEHIALKFIAHTHEGCVISKGSYSTHTTQCTLANAVLSGQSVPKEYR